MSRCRFVQPDLVRLALSDGDFIDVKKQLNAGEYRRVFGRLVKNMHFGEKADLNPEQVGLSKIVEYLVGWSFTDPTGQPVPVSESAINNLDQDTYGAITRAIDAHENEIEAAQELAKNEKAGESKSKATSPSPAVSDGAMSGSVN